MNKPPLLENMNAIAVLRGKIEVVQDQEYRHSLLRHLPGNHQCAVLMGRVLAGDRFVEEKDRGCRDGSKIKLYQNTGKVDPLKLPA